MDKAVTVSNEVYANQVKLFGKWSCDEVSVEDISLQVNKEESCDRSDTVR